MRLAPITLACAALLLTAQPAQAETRQRSVYEGRARIVDGDTIRIGGDTIRLWGIDAPESDQVCLVDDVPVMCGQLVSTALRSKIGRSRVQCRYKDWNEGRAAEHSARAVGQCFANGVDLGD